MWWLIKKNLQRKWWQLKGECSCHKVEEDGWSCYQCYERDAE